MTTLETLSALADSAETVLAKFDEDCQPKFTAYEYDVIERALDFVIDRAEQREAKIARRRERGDYGYKHAD